MSKSSSERRRGVDVSVFGTPKTAPIAHDADDMLSIAGVIIWVGVVASELVPELLAEPLLALFAAFGPSDALRAFLPPAEVPLVAGEEGLDLDALVLTLFLRDGPFSLLGGLARFLRRKYQLQNINGDQSQVEVVARGMGGVCRIGMPLTSS
jgi:hypothetical protein